MGSRGDCFSKQEGLRYVMQQGITISFIIPAYNAQSTLPICLKYLMAEHSLAFEAIVVDDGSTDGTAPLLDAWVASDGRIVAVHTANQGPGPARNRGMQDARGTYLCFVDADDYVLWDGMRELVLQAEKTGCQVVGGSRVRKVGRSLVQEGQDIPEGIYDRNGSAQERRLFHRIKTLNTFGYCHGKLYRRDFVLESGVRFENLRFMEDQLFNCMLFASNPRASCSHAPVYTYVVRDNSASRRADLDVGGSLAALLARYDSFLRALGKTDENQDLFVPLAMRVYAWAGFRALEKKGAPAADVLAQLRAVLELPCMQELLRDRGRRAEIDTIYPLSQRVMFKVLYDTALWGDGLFHAAVFCLGAPAMRAYVKATVK